MFVFLWGKNDCDTILTFSDLLLILLNSVLMEKSYVTIARGTLQEQSPSDRASFQTGVSHTIM